MRKTAAQRNKAPVPGPEELFDVLLAPKPAARATVRPVAGEGYYVDVDGKPVARYAERQDAEHCARAW